MSRRFALVGLSTISGFLALNCAQGDQAIPSTSEGESFTSCHVGEGGVRCTNFQGYVVVRRHEDSAPEAAQKSDAVMSANRLYLRADDEKTP